MTIKTRLIILGLCVAAFFIAVPYIILYSLGYRVDLQKLKVTGTGGIYVYAEPSPSSITIDGKPASQNGFFSSAVFAQNLMPGAHQVLVEKDGYYDYQKTLLVKEKEVTKLENVTLFKKEIAFETLADPAQFTLLTQKPASRFTLKNGSLYSTTALIIKNVAAFEAQNNTVLWLGADGLLYRYNVVTKTSTPLSQSTFAIAKKKVYVLQTVAGHIFLQEDAAAFVFDQTAKTFQPFYASVTSFKSSPDQKKVAYWNSHELWYWLPDAPTGQQNILLQKTTVALTDVYWANNDYLLYAAGNTITISEIDTRGNTNAITLPSTLLVEGAQIPIKSPQIFFNPQDKKLYIKNQKDVVVSERLVP